MVSIVIPAYNEEKRILPTLEAYKRDFKSPHELLVVINGTTDQTESVVRNFKKNNPSCFIEIVVIPEAIGKGGAIREGFSRAKGEIIGFVDADLATPVSFVHKMIALIDSRKLDGVIASRLKPGSVVHDRGALRSIAGRVFASLVRFITDLPYADTQCGAKFFTRSALSKMRPHLSASDMTIDVDLLLAAEQEQLTIFELPSEWYDRSSSAMLGSLSGFVKNSFTMFVNVISLQKKYSHHVR